MSFNINRILGLTDDTCFDPEQQRILDEEAMVSAAKEIKSIRDSRKVKTLEERNQEVTDRFANTMNLYEAYDDASFRTKLSADLMFFEHMFERLSGFDQLNEAIGSFYATVHDIYEQVNLKPECYASLNKAILTESIDGQRALCERIVSEFLDHNFFKMSKGNRVKRYMEESKSFAKELISEGADTGSAIQFAIKTALMESLLTQIAFPNSVRYHITSLLEDKDFGALFDQETLRENWETFGRKTHELAKIAASTI